MEYPSLGPAEMNCAPSGRFFHGLKGYLRFYIFLLFIITGSSQQVQLQPFNAAKAECSDGSVIHGKDPVEMFGSVIQGGTGPFDFDIFRIRVGGGLSPVCGIRTDVCSTQSTALCYCYSSVGTNYTVVYNGTADEQDSNATLILSYNGVDSRQQMPIVHGVAQVSVTIRRDASTTTRPLSGVCNEGFLPGKTYSFEICTSNLAVTDFNIATDAFDVKQTIAINNCSSFNDVTLPDTGSLIFSYQETTGCQRPDSSNCTLSGRTVSDDNDSDLALGLGLGLGIPCLIAVIVILVMYKTSTGCFKKQSEKISTGVFIIKVSTTLKALEAMVVQDLNRKQCKIPTGVKVFKYKGEKQDNKNTKLEQLFPVHVGDTVKVTVSVYRDGTFVLDEIVSVAVLEISVKADESLDQLQNNVETDVSEQHPKAELGILIFLLDGKEQDKSMKLGKLFPGLKDGTKLTVIVYLESQDGSHKCELKKPETTESSANSSSKRNNAVSDSPL